MNIIFFLIAIALAVLAADICNIKRNIFSQATALKWRDERSESLHCVAVTLVWICAWALVAFSLFTSAQ